MEIENFLPKYPNINRYKINFLNPYDINFYESIYHKKEFYELKLDKEPENLPETQGDLLKQQKIISRFLSSNTPYNSLLLAHYMGSGKTCSAFGLTENIRENENNEDSLIKIKRVIVLGRGKILLKNLMNELVFTCSKKGKYIPEDYDSLTKIEKNQRIKKKIKEFYIFYQFYEFSKLLNDMTDGNIIDNYSNSVVIIDEIHNIRKKEKEHKDENIQNTYKQIYRFLHLIQSSKILLMSGTPMKDSPEEISSIINLITPENENLPTGNEFIRKYLGENMIVKNDKIDELKRHFKGRVSYLSSVESSVKKKYIGNEMIYNIPTFTLDIDVMSSLQSNIYIQTYEKDKTPQIKVIDGKTIEYTELYTNSRQSSLCVFPPNVNFPNGSYGSSITKQIKMKDNKYVLPSYVKKYLEGKTERERLDKLNNISSKYAKIIKQILSEPDKCVLCYCKLVEGSGSILFSLLLKYFGFLKANGNETKPGLRYALFTHKTSTPSSIANIIKRFNNPDNMTGKFIKIIIISKLASEGISFKHIQGIHILTPHWNYSEIAQAISRGIRLGSHKDLIDSGITPVVDIYQHVSVPSVNSPNVISIDRHAYMISARKDISIKSMEKLLKESSVDCALTYNINYKENKEDYSRECDYGKCEYLCDGITENLTNNDRNFDLDVSTYNLYYNKENIDYINDTIKKLFETNFSINLNIIKDHLLEYTLFDIITSLNYLINKNIQIKDKYGELCYIKEYNNYYFLVKNISVKDDYFSGYYVENNILRSSSSYKDILKSVKDRYLPYFIDKLVSSVNDDKVFNHILKFFSSKIKEFIIESVILAKENGINTNKGFQDKILDKYKYSIKKIDNTWYSSYLTNNIRCLKNGIWSGCSQDDREKLMIEKTNLRTNLEKNIYGFYGIKNPYTKEFSIRDLTKEIDPDDKRKKYTGKICTSFWKEELAEFVKKSKLQYPKKYDDFTDEYIYKEIIEKNNDLKKYIRKTPSLNREELRSIAYWIPFKKEIICDAIEKWITNNNLILIEEKNKNKNI